MTHSTTGNIFPQTYYWIGKQFFEKIKAMIHGNTNHPVNIKKISLRIWKLRDEVEAIVKAKVVNEGITDKKIIKKMFEDYYQNASSADSLATPTPALNIVDSNDGLDDSEDAMAAALAETQNSEMDEGEAAMAAAIAEANGEQDDGEAAMAAAIAEANGETTAATPTKAEDDIDNSHIIKLSKIEGVNGANRLYQQIPEIDEDKIINAKTVLSEITMEGLHFFSSSPFLSGQSIVLDFLVPKRFVLNAEIVYSRPLNIKSRIISETRLTYRAFATFTFLKEGERTILRNFVQSIEPDIPEPVATPQASSESEEDDFDDLDDFDL